MVFPQNKPPSDIYTGKPDNYHEIITVLGYGYTQAFFTRSYIYPFIGISGSYYLEENKNFFSISAGLNLKLDTDPVR